MKFQCLACYEERPARKTVKLSCHAYCKGCFRQLPPKCCGPIDEATCLKNIPRGLRKVYKAKKLEYSVPSHKRYYCPWPDCGIFVPDDEKDKPFDRARCKRRHVTCRKCLGAAHNDPVNCEENQDLKLVTQMADREGWRRCWKCGTMIEHTSFCRRMHCRCGAEFCFVCGARWWSCRCTERHLRELKDRVARQAEIRRQTERVAKERMERVAQGAALDETPLDFDQTLLEFENSANPPRTQ
ncbi:hypothetical protein KVR01_005425 [Diaporthe batatas]|uniref:uncharacterized protein n=1 Tax=Diaporthe batatas TaxID=748121 RepID=UPI001D052A66|nr:uncharacterized protein KVR01_005425 [Diaporthe batatas]KAG8165150.1 hypothetical protein KVR01_005425 [Diaporthe batatas]